MSDTEETIVAIASPTSPAPRGVVRLTGTDLLTVLARLGIRIPNPGAAFRLNRTIDLGPTLGTVGACWLLWPTGRSYTGQPSAELHLPGSLPVLRAAAETAVGAGARAARPGEFTMRAFLAGRLDLTQAEAVLGVIEAEERGALDHALLQLAGNLSRPLEQLRSDLLDLLADVEAGLDFVDEDIEFISDAVLTSRLADMAGVLKSARRQLRARETARGQISIALCGEPNAGKSQLLNRLTQQQAAIVSEHAGTTRDTVVVDGLLEGRSVRWIDTAGLERADHSISRLAQEQSKRAAANSDIRIWCVDLDRPDLSHAVATVNRLGSQRRPGQVDLWVGTKSDATVLRLPTPWINTSGWQGNGIDELAAAIKEQMDTRDLSETSSVAGTASRCRESLMRATESLEAAIQLADYGEGHELIADELRVALRSIGEITGSVYTDDILDRVFGRFCIGK